MSLTLLALLCSNPAGAQAPPAPPTPAPTASTSASAQPSSPEDGPAKADRLYQEARELFDRKDYDAACAKFAESQAIDPAPGTVIALAVCDDTRGRFASAARRWKEAESVLPRGDSRKTAAAESARISEAKAPKIVLRSSPQAPAGTTVSLDGKALAAADLGIPLLVDPGEHRLVINAPGHVPREVTIHAASGPPQDVVLVPGAATPALPPTATVTTTVTAPPPVPPSPGFLEQHKASFSVLGGGVALAGVGLGFALDLTERYRVFAKSCSGGQTCSEAERSAVITDQILVNTMFAAAGAAGIAAVSIFLFAEPSPVNGWKGTKVSLAVGPGGATLTAQY